ncbi:MAG: AI-2E family transporter [Minisyncoccia bacterium]
MAIRARDLFLFWLIPALLFFLWYIRNLFFIIILGIIIGLAIQEWSLNLKKKIKTPFIVNLTFFYILLIISIILIIYFLGPIIALEIKEAIPGLQDYFQNLGAGIFYKHFSNFLKPSQEIWLKLGSFFKNIISTIASLILVIVLSFYTATQINLIPNLIKIFSKEKEEVYINFYLRIKRKFSQWLASQLFLMLFVGILTFLLMKLLKIPYPGLIGLIAGITEIIPILGPIFSGTFAVLVTLTSNPNLIIWVIIGFIIIQQVENHILIPFVAKIIFEINPLVTLISFLIGGTISGIIGILTIIPLSVIFMEIYKEFYKIKK